MPPTPGETRRILSVQPTYDWTCFSHSLLNVSPMPVESSPPLPCPTPCHLLPNCTSCLASKGADGGWQHCVWSSSLQQVMRVSSCPTLVSFLLPLACSSSPHLARLPLSRSPLSPSLLSFSPASFQLLFRAPRYCPRGPGGPGSNRADEDLACPGVEDVSGRGGCT